MNGRVRANRAYTFRALGSLPGGFGDSLQALGVDLSNVVGALVAGPDSGLPNKIVDRAAANLFEHLSQPGAAPDAAVDRLPELVFDGVLEVETADGFVGGPRAFELMGFGSTVSVGNSRLGRLSQSALEYAERLQLDDEDRVLARLYAYHRVPLSRRWERTYPGPEAILDLLPKRLLAGSWVGPAEGRPYWLSWTSRTSYPVEGRADFPYKLYVSPRPEAVPEVLPAFVEALTDSPAERFKIGPDASGLLRPDKIVVYLRDARQTAVVADALQRALKGFEPHGVPFTAELSGDGLISWGGDPPPDAAPIGRRSESWRLSVCRRLAEYLLAARRAGLQSALAVDFALARLNLDCVDVSSFAPAGLDRPAARKELTRP